jgi:hypothetical protein
MRHSSAGAIRGADVPRRVREGWFVEAVRRVVLVTGLMKRRWMGRVWVVLYEVFGRYVSRSLESVGACPQKQKLGRCDLTEARNRERRRSFRSFLNTHFRPHFIVVSLMQFDTKVSGYLSGSKTNATAKQQTQQNRPTSPGSAPKISKQRENIQGSRCQWCVSIVLECLIILQYCA